MIKIGVGVVGRPPRDVQKMLLPRDGLKERILRCARFVELAKEDGTFAVDGSELAGEGDRSSPIGPGGERRLGKVERRLLEIALGIAREKNGSDPGAPGAPEKYSAGSYCLMSAIWSGVGPPITPILNDCQCQ
jgi:hypothetical protein